MGLDRDQLSVVRERYTYQPNNSFNGGISYLVGINGGAP